MVTPLHIILLSQNYKKVQVLRTLRFPLHNRPTPSHCGTVAVRPTFGITYPRTDRPDSSRRTPGRFPPQGNTVGRLSLAQGRPHRPYTRTLTYTRKRPMGRSGRTWDGAPRDGARTRTQAAYGSPAARSAAEHPANAPTLPPAAPHRVPRARARSSSCSRPSRCLAATGPAATASIVGLVESSPARTAAASQPPLFAAAT